ncbi:DUF3068 domain-containing protein [Streptosporangium sandarakinum]|uniref:DUF3068 domain-containing protein n=1 Tax=Streptosporangium sandarakinum TaxID=1260955 RepID=UPI0033A174AA
MRRTVGLVLIALGAFLIVLAPLVRFQVGPKLIAAPADYYGISELTAPGARYFSIGDLKVMTGDADITVTMRGDVSQAQGDRVVWDEVMAVNDVTNDNPLISLVPRRSAFNKYTGEAVDCCAANIDKKPVKLEGQVYLFPFDVQKKTYRVFNATAGKAFDARFTGEENVNGVRAYRFEQDVPKTKTETRTVPASIMGVTDTTGDIQVDRYYSGRNTFWVEPTTGSPVKQEQERHEVLTTQDGAHSITAFDATARMTPKTVDALVKKALDGRSQITLLKVTIPLVVLIVGVVMLAAGILMVVAGRGRRVRTR